MRLANAFSSSMRWEKPWIVDMAASSKLTSARRRRRAALSAGSLFWPRYFFNIRATSSSASNSASSSEASLYACSILRRKRSRSSFVAAVVNVTTKIWSTVSPFSRIRRKKRFAIVYVFPVPALASIRFDPLKGVFIMSNVFTVITGPLYPKQVQTPGLPVP